VLMLAVAPVMAQTNTVYTQSDADGPEQSYFDANAFHSGMSGVPYTAWGFTSGTDPMGMYSIVVTSSRVLAAESVLPRKPLRTPVRVRRS
jgi:hypothetical protein